ncbi:protein of unknown function [endosymbiont DhMRE of Dentiscutata heterogama]|uniref:hypothetical protein n=1 Tax=endosymbiont DhMRE of Dentiscutata heterogama TaxID=1609546 RepID=UPI000629D526|nr:hypothetical protein [endosymbiont DhMRE of Dentiscutata heterogama]CFW93040.1 protein of unknown function [endosymbiont DhMRE of Dentiscutata heterogama]
MATTPNLTPEQKEANKNYILANLDKYTIDANGNLFNINPELLGEDGEDNIFCYIGKKALTPEGVVEIKEKMANNILNNINDWELVFGGVNLINFKSKKTEIEINSLGWSRLFGYDSYYKIIGEIGYRENIWRNYREKQKEKEKRDKEFKEWCEKYLNNSQVPKQPKTEPDIQTNQQAEQENPNSTPINNTPNQSNPIPNQEPEQPTNSPLPSPETIQENYNNDKDKSTIENNSNSTTPEQKEQSEALLKLVIEAEFLIKDNQFNPDTLSQLLKEKEQNTEAYQLLKERIEQAINELSSLEQQNGNSNNEPAVNNNKSDISPVKILTVVGVIGVVTIIVAVGIKKALIRKKIKRA